MKLKQSRGKWQNTHSICLSPLALKTAKPQTLNIIWVLRLWFILKNKTDITQCDVNVHFEQTKKVSRLNFKMSNWGIHYCHCFRRQNYFYRLCLKRFCFLDDKWEKCLYLVTVELPLIQWYIQCEWESFKDSELMLSWQRIDVISHLLNHTSVRRELCRWQICHKLHKPAYVSVWMETL